MAKNGNILSFDGKIRMFKGDFRKWTRQWNRKPKQARSRLITVYDFGAARWNLQRAPDDKNQPIPTAARKPA